MVQYNLYGYCLNDPITHVDSDGFAAKNNLSASQRYKYNFDLYSAMRCSHFKSYINGQGRYLFSSMPFGKYYTRNKGRGWIAVYNFMLLINKRQNPAKIMQFLEGGIGGWIGNAAGVDPFRLTKYLKQFLSFKTQLTWRSSLEKEAQKAKAGILLFTVSGGAHYVAFKYSSYIKKYTVYNYYNNVAYSVTKNSLKDIIGKGVILQIWLYR